MSELEQYLTDFFWRWFNMESRLVAMKVANGLPEELYRRDARRAMLLREYWLLASGDDC